MRFTLAPTLLVAGLCFGAGFGAVRLGSSSPAPPGESVSDPAATTIAPVTSLTTGSRERTRSRLIKSMTETDGTVMDRYRRLLEFIRDANPDRMADTVRMLEAEIGLAPGGRELIALATSKWGEAEPLQMLEAYLAGELVFAGFRFDSINDDPFAAVDPNVFPDEPPSTLGDLAARCARLCPDAAWEAALHAPDRSLRGKVIAALLSAELEFDPAAATARLLSLESASRYSEALRPFFRKLSKTEPARYIDLDSQLPARLRVGLEPAFLDLAQDDPARAAAEAIEIQGDVRRSRAISGTLATWLTQDPEAAREWWQGQATDNPLNWESIYVDAFNAMSSEAGAANWSWQDALGLQSPAMRYRMIDVMTEYWPAERWRETVAAMEHVSNPLSAEMMFETLPDAAWRELPLPQLTGWIEEYSVPNDSAFQIYAERREQGEATP